MEPELYSMGQRLKERRKKLKWTQEKTAEMLGVTINHYAAVETGKKDISKKLLIQISKLFDCSLDYLLFGKLDFNLENKLAQKLNRLSPKKRDSAYRIINDLLDAMAIEE